MVRTRWPSSAPRVEVTLSSGVNLADSHIYNMMVFPIVDLRASYPIRYFIPLRAILPMAFSYYGWTSHINP